MPVYTAQCSFWKDSVLPRDAMVITPCFNDQLGTDPQSLADDLCDALTAWQGSSAQMSVKLYDAQGTAPVYPAATSINNQGDVGSSSVPREIAVCLSFYSGRNIPTQRGRVYVPYPVLFNKGTGAIDGRPNATVRTAVGALAGIFSNLGGANVDWSVYSRKLNQPFGITDWWVDDEWDTVRSRGLRATTRLTGTVNDG